jgi:hypothetical protein
MSRTVKDSARNKRRDFEVKLVGDTFDVLRNGEIAYTGISERTLNEVLCVRWGYCGSEFEEILQEVRSVGQKTVLL